jgi:hypothetical protein
MGIFDGLLGGGGGGSPLDLYGDLFTPEQKAALQQRELSQGLFRMAEKLGQAAQPQRAPVNALGALGSALGAFGTGSDITEQALKGMQTAEQVRESQRKRAALNSYQAIIEQALRATGVDPKSPQGQQIVQQTLANQGTPAAPGAPTGGPLASNAPPPPVSSEPLQATPGAPGYGRLSAPTAAPLGGVPGAEAAPSQIGLPGPGMSPFGLPPGQQSGLLPPPPGANPQIGQGGGLLAGLPFDQTAPGAAGADLSNIKIEKLSGEAAPAGVAVPFPTEADPNKPKSAWAQGTTYDAPSRPYDPSVDRPANAVVGPEERGLLARAKDSAAPELARLSQLMRVETLAKPAAAAPSNLTGSNWEVANNNLGGMRRPGVNATPSQGGFQTFATPEAGISAISNQLDRYASGATTGKPLSTIREIVSTWAPPNENDTEGLIKRATRIMGVADNIPLNVRDPAVKAKLIEATVRNEQGGNLPVDPNLIAQVAQAPPGSYAAGGQDTVIPSGRGIPASALQRVADTSGGLLATPPGAGAALATPGSGVIPGINMTPTQLGLLNALGKIGGLDSPFSSLLETYYKSPSYLTEAAGASTRGQLGAEIELKPKLEAAIAWAKIDPNLNEYERKAQIDRYTKQLELLGTAQTSSKEVVVNVPGQPPEKQTLTNEQILRLNSGRGVPERGLPPGTRLAEPYLTPEQTAAQTARGQASVNVDPNAFNITPDPRMLPKGPGTTELAPLGNGVVLPPVNQASPIVGSGDYLRARQKDWSDTENEWSKGVASSHLAEQRMQSIMTAMKSYQTGAWANELSDLRAKLKVVGVTLPDSIAGNPALAQEMLKNNFAASVEAMKSSGLSRWTQAELFAAQKNIAQPNLQPEANLEIGAQSIGALRWERAMKDAWAEAKKYGWRDPQDFQSSFAKANPVQNFVDQARQEIGPLKGMALPPSTGTTPQPPPGGVRERRYNPATQKLE